MKTYIHLIHELKNDFYYIEVRTCDQLGFTITRYETFLQKEQYKKLKGKNKPSKITSEKIVTIIS